MFLGKIQSAKSFPKRKPTGHTRIHKTDSFWTKKGCGNDSAP